MDPNVVDVLLISCWESSNSLREVVNLMVILYYIRLLTAVFGYFLVVFFLLQH